MTALSTRLLADGHDVPRKMHRHLASALASLRADGQKLLRGLLDASGCDARDYAALLRRLYDAWSVEVAAEGGGGAESPLRPSPTTAPLRAVSAATPDRPPKTPHRDGSVVDGERVESRRARGQSASRSQSQTEARTGLEVQPWVPTGPDRVALEVLRTRAEAEIHGACVSQNGSFLLSLVHDWGCERL